MPHRLVRAAVAVALSSFLASCGPRPATRSAVPSTLITNVSLLDGSGAAPMRAAVRITSGRIVAVEPGSAETRAGDRVVDGKGLTLAPGFVDTHSHADRSLLAGNDAIGALNQGITTVVVGQDGESPYPLADFFTKLRGAHPPINVASYVGHGTVRERVLGADYKRTATPSEVARMRELVLQEMHAGALGLSSGLEYDPGIYSSHDELVTLATATASLGGRYISHIRSEDRAFWSAIAEIIDIGRQARLPVQVSHTKLAMKSLWGRAASPIALLDGARARGIDITADVYPYRYWQSGLSVLFPERNFTDRRAAEFALDEIIDIGRQARLPVQVSHTKLAMKSLWGRADSLLALLDGARARGIDITADVYPYRYWQSGLSVLFPERNFTDRRAAEFALD